MLGCKEFVKVRYDDNNDDQIPVIKLVFPSFNGKEQVVQESGTTEDPTVLIVSGSQNWLSRSLDYIGTSLYYFHIPIGTDFQFTQF